ncbi:tyrosine-type recombinase/integrase, partial [uncultured Duncaniella sp.]|uniref:tyrosine-type recombinase/integrase n=1 Tax=uncultured Duncaniella sp. TaxID=2768039 RepID=UPI0025B4B560
WLKDAEITKKLTFHGLRHTFATLLVSNGTDIYTVSKMMTHKNVATTQIYAEVINAKKRAAANSISLK